MKILIIEDERKISAFIQKGLKAEHFTVETASDGEEGLFMAQEGDYDAVILDVMLPKIDGITVCKKLRINGKKCPIIMLTAKDSIEEKIAGLNAGADDYMTKPFSFAELLARIKALTRRKGTVSGEIRVADLILDPDTFEVKRDKKNVVLSATEFKLLKFLMENSPRPVSKTRILEDVWGYDFSPESNIVDVYIKYLRDKIDKGSKKPLLHTVRGIGYKICGQD
ncbi:MAG: response regulator transcription factor [Candidatus Saganbacteria bacterium]|nr:response regulator transcription factor [Candidatus Saganbacteria bacterium]